MRRIQQTRGGAWSLPSLLLAIVLLAVPSLGRAQTLAEKMAPGPTYEQASKFNLAAGPVARLSGNQFECGLTNDGAVCGDITNNPNLGGGFWPRGTPDQYMYRSGLQVLGIIPADAGFAWAGDTVGALFNEGRGNLLHGSPITPIYNSLDPVDVANWPGKGDIPDFPEATAFLCDTSVFNPVLVTPDCGGTAAAPVVSASQQDTWVLYWDGDPAKNNGRDHPMGILVEQRSLAWNYPVGNESIVYFIYRFTNVTNNPRFQALNEARFFGGANALPDEGWRIDSIYVASDSDPDVTTEAGGNLATALLPWNMGIAYDGNFFDASFDYPQAFFHPPFYTNSPGIIGVKYLKSPIDPKTGEEVGLTSFSLHTNPSASNSFFPDPATVEQAWRYVALRTDASLGDPSCTFDADEVKTRRSCALAQVETDVRFFVGSGPFSLEPGQSATVAIAMLAAPSVQDPGIVQNQLNQPGFPDISPGCNGQPIRTIERVAGYIGPEPGGCPAPGQPLDQFKTRVVPGSLLGRALVAQAVFDNKFLLGFSPEAPPFYVVPGNNQVTIVWEPSETENVGDPYIAATGDPNSLLYDPNYRRFDVEGYRIYRGTSPSDLRMIAQFDKTGTTFVDYRCVTDPTHITGTACNDVHEIDLGGTFVQNINVTELASGAPIVLEADTALAARTREDPPSAKALSNTGVPFNYVDKDVRNNFVYYYQVRAFDINSILSGPSSLESTSETKQVRPRPSVATTEAKFTGQVATVRGALPNIQQPTIDPQKGTFSGPARPVSDRLAGQVTSIFAPQMFAPGTYRMVLDSVVPWSYVSQGDRIGTFWFSAPDGTPVSATFPDIVSGSAVGDEITMDIGPMLIPSSQSVRDSLLQAGLPLENAPTASASMMGGITWDRPVWHSSMADWAYLQPAFWHAPPPGAYPSAAAGGSRWFSGQNESMADPTLGFYTAGSLPDVNTIFRLTSCGSAGCPTGVTALATSQGVSQALARRWHQGVFAVQRAADMKFYWGATGLDSVIDVTHNVPVPFSTHVRASYGFMQDADANGRLDWGEAMRIAGTDFMTDLGATARNKVPLTQQPTLMEVDVTGDLVADGPGFGLYVAGEVYFFQTASIPQNTVWTLRTYNGWVYRDGGTYSYTPTPGTPAVPGLTYEIVVTEGAQPLIAEMELSRVHTVPDPYYAVSRFDLGPSNKELQFVNLPPRATIRIYSLSGVLVDVINHESIDGGTRASWDLRNRSGQFVASGVYLFHVTTPDGKEHVGRFTVVNSGFANR